jgi:hypothetical protein
MHRWTALRGVLVAVLPSASRRCAAANWTAYVWCVTHGHRDRLDTLSPIGLVIAGVVMFQSSSGGRSSRSLCGRGRRARGGLRVAAGVRPADRGLVDDVRHLEGALPAAAGGSPPRRSCSAVAVVLLLEYRPTPARPRGRQHAPARPRAADRCRDDRAAPAVRLRPDGSRSRCSVGCSTGPSINLVLGVVVYGSRCPRRAAGSRRVGRAHHRRRCPRHRRSTHRPVETEPVPSKAELPLEPVLRRAATLDTD